MRQRSDLPEEWGAHIRHEAKRLSQWPVSTRKLISRASSVPIRIRFTLPAPPLDDSRPPDRNSSNFQLIELVLSKAEQETSRRNGVVPGSLVTLAVSGRARWVPLPHFLLFSLSSFSPSSSVSSFSFFLYPMFSLPSSSHKDESFHPER